MRQDAGSAPVIADAASQAVADGAPATAVSKSLAQVRLCNPCMHARISCMHETRVSGIQPIFPALSGKRMH